MRVLFVTPFYLPEVKFGGPPKRLHAFARHLSRRGYQIGVVTHNSEIFAGKPEIILDGIDLHSLAWLGSSRYPLPIDIARLHRLIGHADIVHCFGLYNLLCPVAAFLAASLGKPFLLEPMGMFVPRMRTFVLKHLYNATFTRWMAKRAVGIIATSELEAEELSTLARCAPIAKRRNGIDASEFSSLPPRSLMRQKWGVEDNEQLVLSLGRISGKKRLVELVDAFAAAKVARAKLVIAGPVSEPGYFLRLRAAAVRSDAAKEITISEALYGAEMVAALSAADLFALVSENENFGNAAGEAVAAGVPVLLTDTCGIAPIIDGRAGLALPLTAEALVEGLRIMLDPDKREQFMRDPQSAKRDLSWEEPTTQAIALYERVLRDSNRDFRSQTTL
jgi:glycosyltransferase involved in cell wall biosynthesis